MEVNLNLIHNNSCRICLNTKCIGAISFGENQALLNLYQFCIDIIVDLNVLPLRLCKNCVEQIESFAKFKQKCKESEEFWKSLHNVDKKLQNNDDCILKTEKPLSEESVTHNESCIHQNPLEDNKNTEMAIIHLDGENEHVALNIKGEDCKIKVKKLKKVKNRDDIEVHKCIKCNKEYRKSKWLKNHMKSCVNIIQRQDDTVIKKQQIDENVLESNCGLCDLPCHNGNLKNHLNEHWTNNDLKCRLCDFNARDFADMVTHRNGWLDFDQINMGPIRKRKLSNKKESSKSIDMQSAEYIHVPNAAVYCHVCEQRMMAPKSLQFHFRSVHLHKPGGLCSYCNKVLTTYRTWKRHERIHTEHKLFICDLCGRKFLYKYQIEAHLIDHSDVRHFVCETCGKAFKRMSALKGHIENVHEPNSPVVCEHCNRTYKNKDKLALHLKKLTEYKPHQCSVCSKRYLLECELKSHMFWHTDERPHVCEICGSKYKAKGQLKVHMLNHTGDRPHKCSICCKGFGTTSQLKRHMRIHTGIKPHKCLYCKREFHGLKALLEHSLQHKNDEKKKNGAIDVKVE